MQDSLKRALSHLSAAAFTLAAVPAAAEVALCATEQAISCTPYEACERTLPGAVNLPVLMKIDTETAMVSSVGDTGEERTSPIASSNTTGDTEIIHGADDAQPWVIQIDRSTGRFTGTLSGSGKAFVLFGECSWDLM